MFLQRSVFLLRGKFDNREEIEEKITENGGKVVEKLQDGVTHLISGRSTSKKLLEKAVDRGITVVDEDYVDALIREEKLAVPWFKRSSSPPLTPVLSPLGHKSKPNIVEEMDGYSTEWDGEDFTKNFEALVLDDNPIILDSNTPQDEEEDRVVKKKELEKKQKPIKNSKKLEANREADKENNVPKGRKATNLPDNLRKFGTPIENHLVLPSNSASIPIKKPINYTKMEEPVERERLTRTPISFKPSKKKILAKGKNLRKATSVFDIFDEEEEKKPAKKEEENDGVLAGTVFYLPGPNVKMSKTLLKNLIQAEGGTVVNKLSEKVTHMVYEGDVSSPIFKTAEEMNIHIVNEYFIHKIVQKGFV